MDAGSLSAAAGAANMRYSASDECRTCPDMLDIVSEVCRLLARRSFARTGTATADDDVVRQVCWVPDLTVTS